MSKTQSVDALPAEHFIPQATRDNYDQIARDRAAAAGTKPKTEMGKLAKEWTEQHKADPQAGYNHLAEWAKDRDPGDGVGDHGLAAAKSRAIESVRRDPLAQVGGFADDPDVQKALKERYEVDDASDVDPDSGTIPNPGPAPITVTSSSDGTSSGSSSSS